MAESSASESSSSEDVLTLTDALPDEMQRSLMYNPIARAAIPALVGMFLSMRHGPGWQELYWLSSKTWRREQMRSMHRWMRQEQWIVQVVADIFRGQYTQGALAVEVLGPRPDPEIGYLADDEEAQSDTSEPDDTSESARSGTAVVSDTFAVGSDAGVENAGLPDQDSAGQDSFDRNSFDQNSFDQNSSDAEPARSQD
ncbi:hypothetical protein S40285_10120 [Stachybotrys chlorohalonatus IBT 40285]|uniref:Uncharacterized protein n=1 Tax=Stachybotrys chlorohalonatus (strain IBT 40285) TaxID=1283841 RepID=A0A084QVM9_STAC4|nr:hypothetical protein S40285_10120 [Stachybotrys chlorohalonata IBT 40285]